MSNGSSKPTPQQPGLRKWWQVFTPQSEWGAATGVAVGIIALLAPWFLLKPVFMWLVPLLPFSVNIKFSVVTVVIELIAIVVIAAALAVYNKKWQDLGLHKPKWVHLAHALVAFLGYIAVSLLLQMAVQALFGEGYNADQPQELGYVGLDGWELVAAFVPLVIITPLAEELIFRGFVFKGVRRAMPFWAAAFVVSALFGLAHGQWNVGLDVFAMSMISCYLVEKSGSLWPSIFLHVTKNALAFALVYIFAVS